jgi:hypothetical protein
VDTSSPRLADTDARNLASLAAGFRTGTVALVACTLRGGPIPVICVVANAETPACTPAYVPFAILVNEYTTDLLNDLVPPPSLHGEWCWTHVPQKDPPSTLVPPERDANEAGEPP